MLPCENGSQMLLQSYSKIISPIFRVCFSINSAGKTMILKTGQEEFDQCLSNHLLKTPTTSLHLRELERIH